MPAEPLNSGGEPLSDAPMGESGSQEQVVEPQTEVEEPVEGETTDEKTDVNTDEQEFTDLKTVPEELQPIAKKMQGDYTRAMQKIAEEKRTIAESMPYEPNQGIMSPEAQEVKEYMNTPQGSALKEVFSELVDSKLGDVPQKVNAMMADKDIDAAISKYGKENLTEHYDQIQKVLGENPTIPLDMVCSYVLYDKAKEMGKSEIRNKIQAKGSVPPVGTASPMVVSDGKVETFEDAFQKAVDNN